MSALPWPTIFVAILSMAVLKGLGNTTLNEINVTQTAMSAGSMVAGGIAFTIPGLWITGTWHGDAFAEHFWEVFAVAMSGMILGSILTWYVRYRFVIKEKLPYPIGQAAAEAIIVGDAGGKKSFNLFGSMFLASIFTFLRDGLGMIPAAFGTILSPLAISTGYIIGLLYTSVWFLGGVLSYWIIIPLGPTFGWFPSADAAVSFKTTAGIGLMVGTGVGILLSYVISALKKSSTAKAEHSAKNETKLCYSSKTKIFSWIALLIAFGLTMIAGLDPIPSCLLILGIFMASAMASTITGETGINPMEIFGIIILLAIRLFVKVDTTQAFFIAAGVAIACGYTGDLMNDYKTGEILGTNPVAQLISQITGGIIGTVVATVSLFAVIRQFGGVGADFGLPAAQAFAVSHMVNGIGDPVVFGGGLLLGATLYLLKVPVMTLGIGMLLPFEFSIAAFLGGFIRFGINRINPNYDETGTITASGFLGGEGLTGVILAIFKAFT